MFALGFGQDTISHVEAGDKISLDADLGVASFDYLDSNDTNVLDAGDALVDIAGGTDTVISFEGGDTLTVYWAANLDADDFLFV